MSSRRTPDGFCAASRLTPHSPFIMSTPSPMVTALSLISSPIPTHKILVDAPIELPRINYESHAGKLYRYLWGTGTKVEGDFLDCIVKIDLDTGQVMTWYVAGLYPGEPVFVPSPKAQAEDRKSTR